MVHKMGSSNNGIGNSLESEVENEGGMFGLFSTLKKYDLITNPRETVPLLK